MILRYQSSEEIKQADRILYHSDPGEVEFVATDDPMDWYVKEYGGGVALIVPGSFGSVFIPADQIETDEDLEFVSRRET